MPVPTHSDSFSSEAAIDALENTIAQHFLRTGQFSIAETFLEVGFFCNAASPLLTTCSLFRILTWSSLPSRGHISLIFTEY
jgi:hypothetical protein